MAPKSRWGKKDKKEQPAAPVLPVRKTDFELPEAICVRIENYFTVAECEQYMEVLKSDLDWRQQQVAVGGRDGDAAIANEPRLTIFMSDPGIVYEYSGRENRGVGWHPTILEIKAKTEKALEECGVPPIVFNSVQMNRYDGPRHALGFHADNEPDLQKDAPIASVSFGCSRDFVVLDKADPEKRQWTITLADGSFLVMGGMMQQKYLHGVPAAAGGGTGLRINLTFRVCVPRAPRDEVEGQVKPMVDRLAASRGSDPPSSASSGGEPRRSKPLQHNRFGGRGAAQQLAQEALGPGSGSAFGARRN